MTITRSTETNEIYAALSRVHGQVVNPTKDKKGHDGRYSYAELSAVLEASKVLLENEGLTVLQTPGKINIVEVSEIQDVKEAVEITEWYDFPKVVKITDLIDITELIEGKPVTIKKIMDIKKMVIVKRPVTTKKIIDVKKMVTVKRPVQTIYVEIGHSSGQFISTYMEIIVEKQRAMSWGQATGSCITYGRRYMHSSCVSIQADEDDDNQIKAQQKANQRVEQQKTYQKIGTEDFKKLDFLFKDAMEIKKEILTFYKINRLEDLAQSEFNAVHDHIRLCHDRSQKQLSENTQHTEQNRGNEQKVA